MLSRLKDNVGSGSDVGLTLTRSTWVLSRGLGEKNSRAEWAAPDMSDDNDSANAVRTERLLEGFWVAEPSKLMSWNLLNREREFGGKSSPWVPLWLNLQVAL